MENEEVPQQVQDQLGRLQQLQSQFQMIQQQRQQVELRLKEVDEALEELKNAKDKVTIYKSVGSILIKAEGKAAIVKELETTRESLDLRKNTLHKQEGRTREKLSELQSKVQNSLKTGVAGNS